MSIYLPIVVLRWFIANGANQILVLLFVTHIMRCSICSRVVGSLSYVCIMKFRALVTELSIMNFRKSISLADSWHYTRKTAFKGDCALYVVQSCKVGVQTYFSRSVIMSPAPLKRTSTIICIYVGIETLRKGDISSNFYVLCHAITSY